MTGEAAHRMNFGFNTNVRVGNTVYHVQTEDRGPAHPFLDTVVYQTGRVVYKCSNGYRDTVPAASPEEFVAERLRDRLSRQHREVIAQLEAGTLPLHEQPKPQATTAQQTPGDGLEVCLANPENWLASGYVTLVIELRQRVSGQEIGNAEVEALLERGKERVHCFAATTDATGRATLKFPMPANAADGASLVIRATDGALYGELRFRLRAKHRDPDATAAAK